MFVRKMKLTSLNALNLQHKYLAGSVQKLVCEVLENAVGYHTLVCM